MNPPVQHFDIRFTPAELDYIANVLMDRPHREVAVLLANMKSQIEHAQKLDQMRPVGPQEAPHAEVLQHVNGALPS